MNETNTFDDLDFQMALGAAANDASKGASRVEVETELSYALQDVAVSPQQSADMRAFVDELFEE